MEITKLVVSYQETANLGNYSNVKPSATVEVTLADGDDPAKMLADAQAIVRDAVQRQVDDALERNEQEPRYTTEPRYALLVRSERRPGGLSGIAVIALAGTKLTGLHESRSGFRLAAIRRLAERYHRDDLVIDTTIDPEAVQPVLDQIAAEDADIAEERKRERERWEQRAATPVAAYDDDDDDDDDDRL